MYFRDRQDAGRRLAQQLQHVRDTDTVVVALPRGGVEVGAVVARALGAPLGLVLVRKIGHPSNPEYAVGAVAEDEAPIVNEWNAERVSRAWLKYATEAARQVIIQRRQLYYGADFLPPTLIGKTVVVVDDGMATGLTMVAAVQAVRHQHPQRIVVAVPVAPSDSLALVQPLVDEVIILDNPRAFLGAVGAHYHNFNQVTDEEVNTLLREVRDDLRQAPTQGASATPGGASGTVSHHTR